MPDILYLKINRNIVVHDPVIFLKDIARVTCTNKSIENRVKSLKVYHFQEPTKIMAFSVLKIVQLICQVYPNLEIQNMGENDFLVEYVTGKTRKWLAYLKAGLICVLIFFGSAFTIMTFQEDVSVSQVFEKFYSQVMGRTSDGFTILEISYALGLGVGILVFFNHVGKKKITHDPTPIQVQMRKYEQDVDTTFIENSSRKGTNVDVD